MMIRALVLLLFFSLTGYYLLPFRTPVPGFTTFTLGKLAALGLVAAVVVTGAFRVPGPVLRLHAPLLALAAWLPVASVFHAVSPLADAKLLLGHTLAALAGLVAATALADPGLRRRAVAVVTVAGCASIAAALAEPFSPLLFDPFWRLFRSSADAVVHWQWGEIYRVCGIFSAPPELANFLVGWFPLAVVWLAAGLAPRSPWRVPLLVAGLGGMAAFTLTLTRSSLLGAAAGAAGAVTLLLLVGAPPPSRRGGRSRLPARLAVVAAGLGVAALVWLHLRGRLTALSAAAVLAMALGVLSLAARRAARDPDSPAPAPASRLLAWTALLLVLAPLLGFGRLAPTAPPGAAGPWQPEVHHPGTAAERMTESAAHAGWQRQKLWRVAGWMLPASPVAGPGWYTYATTIHQDPALKARFDLDPARGDIDAGVDNPHNLYLTALTTGGVIALGLLVHVLVLLVRVSLHRALDRGRPPFDRALAAGLLMYWCAFIAMGMVGQEVFTIGGAVTFHAWAALTLAAPGRPARRPR